MQVTKASASVKYSEMLLSSPETLQHPTPSLINPHSSNPNSYVIARLTENPEAVVGARAAPAFPERGGWVSAAARRFGGAGRWRSRCGRAGRVTPPRAVNFPSGGNRGAFRCGRTSFVAIPGSGPSCIRTSLIFLTCGTSSERVRLLNPLPVMNMS